ncbi:hypothetical protein JXA40_07545 [bacterium]|nr:hypothetical protein [candidate division CSSED10-310 bacterium]
MENVIDRLIELHKLDMDIARLRKQCCEIPAQIKLLDGELSRAGQKVAGKQVEIRENEKKIRSREQAIEGHREQQGKYRVQLFKLKSNREYQALNNEILLLNDKISEIETDILEYFERIDAARKDLNRLEMELRELERKIVEKQKVLKEQYRGEEKLLVQKEAERKELIKAIDAEYLERYQRLVRKHGSAVAEIVSGSCGGCYVRIRPQLAALARSNDVLVNCEKCGRFLYWSDVSES